jgi:methyl-accepting chemotaxis protein
MREVIQAYEQDLDSLLKGTKHRTRAQLLDELRTRVGSFDSQISDTVQAGNPELHRVTEDLQTSSQEVLTLTSELETQNWARVQSDHAAARHLLLEAEVALSVVSFFTLIVSIWVSYFLPGQIVKPLVNLKEAVDHATLGDYGIEFDVQGKGETVELAKSLQQLFAVMQRKVSSQSR